MRLVAEKDAGRVGERRGNAAIEHAHFAEQADLFFVERMLGVLGAGEMAHQQRDAVIFGADARRQSSCVIGRNAEPVHAGVDVQRRAAAPLCRGDEGIPFGQFDHAADHRPCAQLGIDRRRAGDDAIEHIDCCVRCRVARARRASDRSATKNVLQPARASAVATCSMPQP